MTCVTGRGVCIMGIAWTGQKAALTTPRPNAIHGCSLEGPAHLPAGHLPAPSRAPQTSITRSTRRRPAVAVSAVTPRVPTAVHLSATAAGAESWVPPPREVSGLSVLSVLIPSQRAFFHTGRVSFSNAVCSISPCYCTWYQ